MSEIEEGPPAEHTFRALITTDNHLGFCEKDGARCDDSFNTFEEILQLAREHQVDCVLHAGDLFHKNQPSRNTMVRTVELLRKYCMGDEPVSLEVLSDHQVNYLDPNLNVDMPVFAVHGNHDDPAGVGGFSAMDVLSRSGLLNYVGKSTELDQLEVSPVILRKGDTCVSLYGLGHVRDERLYRLLGEQNVNWMCPDDPDFSAFNVLLIHQNRVAHSKKNFVHELMLPEFLDFVIWGHEHECLITPTQVAGRKFFVSQPGSSVATSLIEGESKPKHVALLQVYGEQFNLTPLPLTTVRPFLIRDVELQQCNLAVGDEQAISDHLVDVVDQLLQQLEDEDAMHESDTLPLLRLRVNLSGGYERFSPQRFGQQFVERVANPSSIIHFIKAKAKRTASKGRTADQILEQLEVGGEHARNTVENEVNRILLEDSGLSAIPMGDLGEALRQYVEKEDNDALDKALRSSIKKAHRFVIDAAKDRGHHDLDGDMVQQLVGDYVLGQQENTDLAAQDLNALLEEEEEEGDDGPDDEVDEDEDEEEEEAPPPKRRTKRTKKANTKKAPARRTSTRRSSRKKKKVECDEEDDDEDDELEEIEVLSPVKKKRAAPRAARGRKRRVADKDLEEEVDFGALIANRKRK